EKLKKLVSSYRVGKLIRSGIKLALIGRPNVGKSSLFNSLLGRDRAIVTHVPGTTRDSLNESFVISGIPVDLIDTAGIRETDDIVEQLGVERTKTVIGEADLVIAVVESNSSLHSEEIELFNQFPMGFNAIKKCDLETSLTNKAIPALPNGSPAVKVSATTGEGIEELKQAIQQRIACGAQTNFEDAIITN